MANTDTETTKDEVRKDAYRSASLDALKTAMKQYEESRDKQLNDEAEEYLKDSDVFDAQFADMAGAKARMFAKRHPIRDRFSKFLKKRGLLLCRLALIISGSVLILNMLRFAAMLFLLKPNLCPPNAWMLLPVIPPALALIFGNLIHNYNVWRPKRLCFYVIIGTVMLSILRIFYRILYVIEVPLWLELPVNRLTTPRLVWSGAWLWLLIPTGVLALFLYTIASRNYCDNLRWLEDFRLSEHSDFRRDKDTLYDVSFIQRLDNGKNVTIREKDRWLHFLVVGSTGAGKSSLIGENMAADDLLRRCENEDKLRAGLEKMIENHEATLIHAISSEAEFRPEYVRPEKGFEDKYYDLLLTYRVCGYTIVAPDSSMCDIIYDLCIKKDIKVNRIDPVPDELTGKRVKDWTGFNPLYISPSVKGKQRKDEILARATMFADVLGKLNDQNGKKDEYYASVNRALVIAVLVELIATFDSFEKNEGHVPTLRDMQEILGDFSRIKPYHDKLLELDATDHSFRPYTDFVKLDMLASLGDPRLKQDKTSLWSQGRGLRLLVNDFLSNRHITDVLCAEKTMDIDSALANGEVTLVNYGLNLGENAATAFAGFFLLTFIGAVFRRPGTEWSRSPHILINDECAVTAATVGTGYQQAATLFRKYRVSMVMMLQSTEQFNRLNDGTKEVLLSNCSTLIVFGRANTEDMRRFSELAGVHEVVKEQHTVTETAITDESPNKSMGTREMVTMENVLEGSDIRYLKFGEFTLFTVRDSSPLLPFYARCNFRDRNSKAARRARYKSSFMKYSSPSMIPVTKEELHTVEAKVAEIEEDELPFVEMQTVESLNALREADIGLDDLLGDDLDDSDFGKPGPVLEGSEDMEEKKEEEFYQF